MNIREGLERINSLWWGFLALVAVVGVGVSAFQQNTEGVLVGAAGLVFAFVGHRAVRWVIRGFFPLKQQA